MIASYHNSQPLVYSNLVWGTESKVFKDPTDNTMHALAYHDAMIKRTCDNINVHYIQLIVT